MTQHDIGIGRCQARDGCDIERNTHSIVAPYLVCHFRDGRQQLREVDRFCISPRQFGVETRCVGDVADQAIETFHIVLNHFKQTRARRVGLGDGEGFDRAAQGCQGILQSCATSAAKLSIASMRL